MLFGEGQFRFEFVEGWAKIPSGWHLGDVSGVATDSKDRLFVFSRSEHPVIILDRDGRFVDSWGEGVFSRPHGITITADDTLYLTDDGDHTVRKFTADGRLLQMLGTPHQPSDSGYVNEGPLPLASIRRGAGPFNRPTKVAVAPSGDLYVSDGYGNARVHRFSAAGELIQSWGEPGDGPGEFNLPHTVWVHTDGRVFVCDRENSRVQIFSPTGEYLGAWTGLSRASEIVIDREGYVFMAERYSSSSETNMVGKPMTSDVPPRVSVRDLDGNLIASWGGPDPFAPGSFAAAHGLCLDSHGDLYVGDVAQTALGRSGRYQPGYMPIHKFVRI